MHKLVIDAAGTIEMIYSDDLRDLLKEGRAEIRRVSHVEPDAAGGWSADLALIGGPVLGSFETRAEALAAEVNCLNEGGF